jgi:hypothetical protein
MSDEGDQVAGDDYRLYVRDARTSSIVLIGIFGFACGFLWGAVH